MWTIGWLKSKNSVQRNNYGNRTDSEAFGAFGWNTNESDQPIWIFELIEFSVELFDSSKKYAESMPIIFYPN